jgi:hypothetical protein
MRTAFPVQEPPVRSALTVAANCVNRTRRHAASVTAYSVLHACPSIQCSTPKLHQQTTGNAESEKGLNGMGEGNYLIALASRLRETVRRVREETPQSSPRRTQLMWTTTSGVIALILTYRSHSMAALVGCGCGMARRSTALGYAPSIKHYPFAKGVSCPA